MHFIFFLYKIRFKSFFFQSEKAELMKPENFITKKQKKAALAKIAKPVAAKLEYYKETEYEYAEICHLTGIRENRMSELVNKYYLPERTLVQLIRGGFVKISELIKKEELTEKERQYLETFVIYEDEDLHSYAAELKRKGKDPAKILLEHIQKTEG